MLYHIMNIPKDSKCNAQVNAKLGMLVLVAMVYNNIKHIKTDTTNFEFTIKWQSN